MDYIVYNNIGYCDVGYVEIEGLPISTGNTQVLTGAKIEDVFS